MKDVIATISHFPRTISFLEGSVYALLIDSLYLIMSWILPEGYKTFACVVFWAVPFLALVSVLLDLSRTGELKHTYNIELGAICVVLFEIYGNGCPILPISAFAILFLLQIVIDLVANRNASHEHTLVEVQQDEPSQ